MRFTKICLSAVFIMMLLLSSCGKSNENTSSAQNMSTNAPQPGAFMQNPADLYGEVKSISGNQITIALMEMPQRRQLTDEERAKMQENRDNAPQENQGNNGRKNSNNNGGNNGDGRNQNGRSGGFMGERKLTGKTETITVKDGIPITTFSRNNGENQQNELKISDIKAGSVIQVWYKKDAADLKEIDRIRIMQVPEQSQKNSN